MLNHFYVRLVHEDIVKRYVQCRSMHVMAAFFLLFYSLQFLLQQPIDWTKLLMVGLPTIVIFAISIFSKQQIEDQGNNTIFRILEVGFLLMGAQFFYQQPLKLVSYLFVIVALFIALVFWMEHRVFSKQFVDFHQDKIIIPGTLMNKNVLWQKISNIIINHDILTIEYKNNSFYQHKIFDSFTDDERIQFQTFCKRQLGQSSEQL